MKNITDKLQSQGAPTTITDEGSAEILDRIDKLAN